MSKLFNLKEWLTVADAARHLSIVFSEDVTESDVLRLALDGRLRLSVNFVNHATARCGKVISWEETEWMLLPGLDEPPGERVMKKVNQTGDMVALACPTALQALLDDIPPDEREKCCPLLRSLNIDGKRFLSLSDEITTLRGVWDLPMIGNEKLDIEHEYQHLTGGPSVTLQGLDGAFVEGRDGQICQLQEDFDDNQYIAGSRAALERLKQQIAERSINGVEAESLLNRYKEQRKEFLEYRRTKREKDKYFPAGGLPEDSVLVVRTEALRDFEKTIANQPTPIIRDESLIAVIAALLAQWPNGKPPTGKDLEKAAQVIGLKISDDTIRKALKAARDIAPSLPS